MRKSEGVSQKLAEEESTFMTVSKGENAWERERVKEARESQGMSKRVSEWVRDSGESKGVRKGVKEWLSD